jgi:tRNA(adenine34) deaminase
MHEDYMRQALALAEEAQAAGEVPVGAVIVLDGAVIGAGRNSPIAQNDPTACARIGNYRLEGATIYSTLEPCVMCAGAMVAARVSTLVFAARDLRFGGVRSKFRLADSDLLNHRLEIVEGVLAAESARLLQSFFTDRR